MDDMFFRLCMAENPEAFRLILRIILDKPELEIEDFHIQDHIDNYSGRSITLDSFAKDASTGDVLNVEVQKSKDYHIPQRARYHSAMLDTHRDLKKNQDFKDLRQNVVIFLCSDDILKRGKPIYRIVRKTDDNEPFNDGSKIIILNCSYKGNHRLQKLIDDLNATDADKMNYKELAEVVNEKKEKQKGDDVMTIFDEVYEDGRSDGIEEGIKKGFEKGQIQANIEAAKKMLSMGKFTYDDIAESTSLPLETIKELAG